MTYNFKDLVNEQNRKLKVIVKHDGAFLWSCDVSDDAIWEFSSRFGIDFYVEVTSCPK